MQLIVIFGGISVFLLLVAVLSAWGRRGDQLRRRLTLVRQEDADPLQEELKLPLSQRFFRPLLASLTGNLEKLASRKSNAKSSKNRERTQRLLTAADLAMSFETFSLVKLAAAFLLAGAGWFASGLIQPDLLTRLMGVVLGLAIGCWAPLFLVRKKGQARNAAILRELPEVMDLLVVSVEAGLGLDAAITRLYEKNQGPLLQELMSTVRDVQMGLPRRESLKEMADRTDVQELKTFATSIIQGEQLGVSIKSVLRTQADQLRLDYRQRCQAKAQKAPVKMLIPMVVFIFPVLFIILLGPSLDQLSGLF